MIANRRAFLFGATAALAAPTLVRAESLMKLWVPPTRHFSLNGYMTDADAWHVGPLRKPLYFGQHIVVGSYYDRPDGMTVYEYDLGRANPMFVNRRTGTVDNATMFNILRIDNIRPFRDLPFVSGRA